MKKKEQPKEHKPVKTEKYSMTYNKQDDGLRKEIVDKETWD